jgi:CBS domain-containing protein
MKDSAARAAQLMWDHDCGVIPVLNDQRLVVGVVTDRDLCMAGLFQAKPFSQIPLESCMANNVIVCHPDDDVAKAERLMSERQVKRVPVVDTEGALVGILSVGDVARQFSQKLNGNGPAYLAEELVHTVAAISQPRAEK